MKLTPEIVRQAIKEIDSDSEVTRRTQQKKRHDIYNDGGKAFLIEQIKREFSKEAVDEMRLAPINLLKKLVNKRAQVYKKPPTRTTKEATDQKLVDFYTKKLKVNSLFQKANRKFVLHSNTVIYQRPVPSKKEPGKACIGANVVAPFLYSIMADHYDQTCASAYIFNAFIEKDRVTPDKNLDSATGVASYSANPGFKAPNDLIESNEKETTQSRQFLFWTDEDQLTVNEKGEVILMDEEKPLEVQMQNPIKRLPVTNVAKDRDNEPWAMQGEDMIDLTIAIQLGWTDVMTIAKHQGFSVMTIVSEEEPRKLTIGVNKAVWLKAVKDSPVPSITYAQAQSPLNEYKDLLMELLGLLLTTNDMEPNSVSGKATAQSFTSGFHALIAKADNLEAIEADKEVFQDAEQDFWEVVSKWHNWLADVGVLEEEAKAMGKFSEKLEVTVLYQDVKPLESDDEKLNRIEKKIKLKLITRHDALKELHPGMTDAQIEAKLKEIDEEGKADMEAAAGKPVGDNLGPDGKPIPGKTPPQLAGHAAAAAEAGGNGDVQKPGDSKNGAKGKPAAAGGPVAETDAAAAEE